jgi:hypothetical protein
MSPLVGVFLGSWKGEWNCGSRSLPTVAATAQWGKAQLVHEYLHLNLARESGGTEDQPEPTPGPNHHRSPKFHPLHSAPGTRTRCTTAKQQNRRQTAAARLHFPLRNTRRQRLNLQPAVSTLGPSLHSILNSWFSSPRHIRQAVRHSVSVVLSRPSTLLSAALLIPCKPSSLTPECPERTAKDPGIPRSKFLLLLK